MIKQHYVDDKATLWRIKTVKPSISRVSVTATATTTTTGIATTVCTCCFVG